MKILITFFSQSGNTEKIAKAIYEEVLSQGNEANLKHIADISTKVFDDYDLIFLGSACHDADVAKPAKKFLNSFPKFPKFKLAGFTTHSTYLPEGSQRNKELYEKWASKCIKTFHEASETKKIDFKAYFSCMGKPSPPIANFIHEVIIKDENEWKEYMEEVAKHPNEEDLQNARKFARDVLTRL